MGAFGYVPMPQEVAKFRQELRNAYGADTFYGAKPNLQGLHKTKPFAFLWDAEIALFGKTLPEWDQKHGTCVSQGFGRAATDRIYRQAGVEGRPIKPVEVCFETIYIGSRINVGCGQLGSSEGSCGSWAAKYLHDYGALPRGVYGQYDLTHPQEDWAVSMSNPGGGVPQALLTASAPFRVQQVHHVQSAREAADCIAAGYSVSCPSQQGFTTTRDSRGMCHAQGTWPHNMEVRGYFIDDRGQLCFIPEQSWGSAHSPDGPDHIFLQGGQQVQLPQGAFGCDEQTFDSMVRAGDTWAVGYVPGIPK